MDRTRGEWRIATTDRLILRDRIGRLPVAALSEARFSPVSADRRQACVLQLIMGRLN